MTAVRFSPPSVLAMPPEVLAEQVATQMRFANGWTPSAAEQRSWRASIPALARDLVDAGLEQVEMLIEYQLPMTSKRADVILAGIDPQTAHDSFIVVELKQWSSAHLDTESDIAVLVEGTGGGPRLHPVDQVRRYSQYLRDFLRILHDNPSAIRGVAYLHNALDLDVIDLFDLPSDADGRMFTKQRRGAFIDYLKKHLSSQSGAGAADRFLNSRHGPSKQLIELAAEEIKNREQFVLLDEQVLARDLVLRAVETSHRSDHKEVLVVSGGPGSGKSVIALSTLGELYRRKYPALHATGSKSFTETLRRVAGKGQPRIRSLFKYFNSFMTADKNSVDVLLCDEAHRIRSSSNNRFTKRDHRSDRPQIAELVDVARVPVFLLDEYQVVKPDEIGSVAAISDYAAVRGLSIRQIDLDAQFRCGGSRAYERWVLRLLGLESGGPMPWDGDKNFRVQLAQSPGELRQVVRSHENSRSTARITAGYCWPWSNPEDGKLVPDVRIGRWSHPWNAKSDRAIGGAPPSSLWATDPGGINQVGCVYTAQGFEYNWNGVILGPDVVIRDGKLHTVRAENKDPAFRSKSIPDERVDAHIRHIYKVLLTRGLDGVVLFAVDEETQATLSRLIPS